MSVLRHETSLDHVLKPSYVQQSLARQVYTRYWRFEDMKWIQIDLVEFHRQQGDL